MTLSTHVLVLDEVDPYEVFRFCQAIVGRYDEGGRPPAEQRWRDKQQEEFVDSRWVLRPESPWCVSNQPMQDLPAWLLVSYRRGGPLRSSGEPAHDEDCEPDCDSDHSYRRDCWLDVDFDTAYGYRNDAGMGCGDLHAALISELGSWLDSRGVRWEWINEYSGDVHGGPDRYERLADLVTAGFESAAWLRSTILPAIAARIAEEGVGQ